MKIQLDFPLKYNADFDTALQRYDFRLSDEIIRVKLIRSLLYTPHLIILDSMIIDHNFFRNLFLSDDFKDFITKPDINDRPAVVVGFRSGCESLLDVIDNMRKYRWYSSSMLDLNVLKSDNEPLEEYLQRMSCIRPNETAKIRLISDFLLKQYNDITFDLNRDNYNKLVKETIEQLPTEYSNREFDSYRNDFLTNMDNAGEQLSRSELTRISEGLAKNNITYQQYKTKLQYIGLDMPWNVNAYEANQIHFAIGAGPFLKPLLADEVLNKESLKNSYTRLEVENVGKEYSKMPILTSLKFSDLHDIRTSEGFEGSINDLISSGERNLQSRLTHHEELIADIMVKKKKVQEEFTNLILRKVESPTGQKVEKVVKSSSLVWTAIGVLLAVTPGMQPFAIGPFIGAGFSAFGHIKPIVSYFDGKKKKKMVISELSMFKED